MWKITCGSSGPLSPRQFNALARTARIVEGDQQEPHVHGFQRDGEGIVLPPFLELRRLQKLTAELAD
jgi:hypothetical protein